MISEQNGLQEGNKASRAYVIKPCVLIAGRPALPRSAPHLPLTSGGDLLLLCNWFEGQRKALLTKNVTIALLLFPNGKQRTASRR